MKYLFVCLFALTVLTSCEKDEDNLQAPEPNCNIEGRWIITSLGNTLYEFKDGLRYTIYSSDGTFGTIEDAIPGPHDYMMRNDSLVVDLNFGNISVKKPSYKCDCNILTLTDADGNSGSYHKDGYAPEDCDE